MNTLSKKELFDFWSIAGKNSDYEYVRQNPSRVRLRSWIIDKLSDPKLVRLLDSHFVTAMRNGDFYPRMWELELASRLLMSGLSLRDTGDAGFDFSINLNGDRTVWIEAVYTRADLEMKTAMMEKLRRDLDKVPVTEFEPLNDHEYALRFAGNLWEKAKEIREKKINLVKADDLVIIAIAGHYSIDFRNTREVFRKAVYPIDHELFRFTRVGEKLESVPNQPTHEYSPVMYKKSGSAVPKTFLYKGEENSHIDGVIFSEYSELQDLLGTMSSEFDETTAHLHLFPNFSGKEIPDEFGEYLYWHKFVPHEETIKVELQSPKRGVLHC